MTLRRTVGKDAAVLWGITLALCVAAAVLGHVLLVVSAVVLVAGMVTVSLRLWRVESHYEVCIEEATLELRRRDGRCSIPWDSVADVAVSRDWKTVTCQLEGSYRVWSAGREWHEHEREDWLREDARWSAGRIELRPQSYGVSARWLADILRMRARGPSLLANRALHVAAAASPAMEELSEKVRADVARGRRKEEPPYR